MSAGAPLAMTATEKLPPIVVEKLLDKGTSDCVAVEPCVVSMIDGTVGVPTLAGGVAEGVVPWVVVPWVVVLGVVVLWLVVGGVDVAGVVFVVVLVVTADVSVTVAVDTVDAELVDVPLSIIVTSEASLLGAGGEGVVVTVGVGAVGGTTVGTGRTLRVAVCDNGLILPAVSVSVTAI
jgi:hypothetical protein